MINYYFVQWKLTFVSWKNELYLNPSGAKVFELVTES